MKINKIIIPDELTSVEISRSAINKYDKLPKHLRKKLAPKSTITVKHVNVQASLLLKWLGR